MSLIDLNLRACQIFSELTEQEIQTVSGLFEIRELGSGQYACDTTDRAAGFTLVCSGKLEMSWPGFRISTRKIAQGDYWGDISLFEPTLSRKIKVVAIEQSKVIDLSSEAYVKLRDKYPLIAYKIAYGSLLNLLPVLDGVGKNIGSLS